MTRCLVSPVQLNAVALSSVGVLPVAAPTAGIDAAGTGGTAFATAWTGFQGIMFPNNGACIVYFWCGTAAGGVVQILQGRKVEGQLPPPATFGPTLSATSSGWIPPLSPQDFNQQDISAFGGGTSPGGATAALGGAVGSAGQGLTCIDFTTTTNLSVRVYQLSQVTP
jgi:hypothetical protein